MHDVRLGPCIQGWEHSGRTRFDGWCWRMIRGVRGQRRNLLARRWKCLACLDARRALQLQLKAAEAAVEEYGAVDEGAGDVQPVQDADDMDLDLQGLQAEVTRLKQSVKGAPYRYSSANSTVLSHWMERHPFVPSSSVLRKKIALDALIVDMVSALRASR